MEISGFNKTDASQTIFLEGQARNTVNNNAREVMGAVARAWFDSVEGDKDSTGSANAYVVAANRTLSAYYDGMRIGFHANFANTGAATLDVDSVGAKTIKKNHDVDLASGDIEANQYVEVIYSATDDTWQMLSPLANAVVAASESASGIVELATQAEVNTGSDTARAITPAGLTGWTPAVGTVTVVSTDKVLLADASASGVLKQGLVSDITAMVTSPSVALYQNQQTSGTTGPTFTAGAWRTYALTTEVVDADGIGSLSSNQITLGAGTYEVFAVCQGGTHSGGTAAQCRARIYDATNTTVLVQGPQHQFAQTTPGITLAVVGVFTLAGSAAVELQIYPKTQNFDGNPAMTTGEVEIYASVLIRKVA